MNGSGQHWSPDPLMGGSSDGSDMMAASPDNGVVSSTNMMGGDLGYHDDKGFWQNMIYNDEGITWPGMSGELETLTVDEQLVMKMAAQNGIKLDPINGGNNGYTKVQPPNGMNGLNGTTGATNGFKLEQHLNGITGPTNGFKLEPHMVNGNGYKFENGHNGLNGHNGHNGLNGYMNGGIKLENPPLQMCQQTAVNSQGYPMYMLPPPITVISPQNGAINSTGYPHGDSPPPPPRQYKPCVVCSDKSSGYHYGVSSCEGCKGFFRRSVQKNMQFTCHKELNCVINKMTRNRCQACRFEKCFNAGMSKEAVRNDRNKKKKKGEESPTSSAPPELSKQEQELVDNIHKAHLDTFPTCDDSKKYKLSESELEAGGILLWERITDLSAEGIKKIVEFSRKLSGFNSLPTTDQITLLKGACLEVLILRLGLRYNKPAEDDGEDSLTFSNGLTLTRQQLESGGFGSITEDVLKFHRSLHDMDCDSTEFALLAAVCLISGDRSGLEDPAAIEKHQEPILEALKHYMHLRRPQQPLSFAKLLMKLTDLRTISVTGAERVLQLRDELKGDFSPLILEMLDRTENVCI